MPIPSTIPEWVPSLPGADTLNTQNDVAATQRNVIAAGEVVPVVLGPGQVGGRMFALDYDLSTDTWTVGYIWCVGEVEAIDQIWLDGAAPVSGISRNDYLGTTSQTADPLLAAAISGYTDTLVITRPGGSIGLCYSVIQYTGDQYSDFPNAVAEIQGLKTNGGAYSDSPARAIGYLIEHAILGPGSSVDSTTLGVVATANAETVSSESRREIGLVIDKPQPFHQWLGILAGYASCWINKEGSTYYFVSDRPRSSDASLDGDDWYPKSFSMQGPGKSSVPTVVEVAYTDITEDIWRTQIASYEAAGVSAGTTPRRVSRVSMPGIQRHTQAMREAEERQKKLSLMQPSISFIAMEDHLDKQLGDVLTITRGSQLVSQDFRVTSPPIKKLGGGIRVALSKYDASVYSDVEPSDPSFGATPGLGVGDGVAEGTDGADGADGADGKDGFSAGSELLLYNDLNTGALSGASEGSYRFTNGATGYANWATITDGSTITEIEIDAQDRHDVDRSAVLSKQSAGHTMTWRESDGRWLSWRITSVSSTDPGSGTVFTFGVVLVAFDETDGSGNITGSLLDVDWIFTRAVAFIGDNVVSEDGTIPGDADLRNIYLVGNGLGGSIVPNSGFNISWVDSDGNLRPAYWYGRVASGDIGNAISFADEAVRSEVNIVGGATHLISSAFPPNPKAKYEAVIRIRSVGSSQTASLRVFGKTSDLAAGAVSLSNALGGVDDPEIDASGSLRGSTSISCTTSFQIFTIDLGFWLGASDEWGSIGISADASEEFDIDYLIVREISSDGAPSGTMVGDATADSVGDTVDGAGAVAEIVSEDGGGIYRAVPKGLLNAVAFDGDAVSFTQTWGKTPSVMFGGGGLTTHTSLGGDVFQSYKAQNVTTTGFDAVLKLKETVGTVTARTDTTESTPSSPSGLDRSINKGQSAEAWDGNYTFRFDVNITNGAELVLGVDYEVGYITIGIYTNDGSGWVQRATRIYSGGGLSQTETINNLEVTVNVSGLGLNDDFGVTVESSTYGGSLLDFDQVTYGTATAPTTADATEDTDGIPFWVLGE